MNSPQEGSENFKAGELQENLALLRQTYLFPALPMESLKVFAYMCTRETVKAGDYLFRQGEDDGQAIMILTGTAVLIREDNGRETEILRYDPGAFLGSMALLGEMHRLFSLRADTDLLCLILTRQKFSSTLNQFPQAVPKIMKLLVRQINTWEERFLVSRTEGCEACLHKIGVSMI
jgi:CRP-like cAMP-binding protein